MFGTVQNCPPLTPLLDSPKGGPNGRYFSEINNFDQVRLNLFRKRLLNKKKNDTD